MERKDPTDESFARAFALAYFIHGDRATALKIATEALARLEVAVAAQDKRLYYRNPERHRTKVSVSELHLLQRLVYVTSEPLERQAEQAATTAAPGEEDMLVRFIKHLVQITIRRNSFYVTLGLSRLLYNYSTAETMNLYNVVVQDPERVRDDYYYRSRKGKLMQEVKERFGDQLAVTRGARGEERFQTAERQDSYAALVRQSLETFTPWQTDCAIHDRVDPFAEEIAMLAFSGDDPDQEHTVEVNRFHAVLHPDCFLRLTASLNLESPDVRLAAPLFMTRDHDEDRKPPRRSRRAPTLDAAELDEVRNLLAEESTRRKQALAGLLRVVVDGQERAQFDPRRAASVNFAVDEADELIEVRTARSAGDVLLAVRLLTDGALQSEHSITLEGGQKLSFTCAPTADATGEMTGASVRLAYHETSLRRAIALSLQRSRFALTDFLQHNAALKPALAFAALAVFAVALALYWQAVKTKPNEEIVTNPTPTPTVIAPTPENIEPAPTPLRRKPREANTPVEKRATGAAAPPLIANRNRTEQSPRPAPREEILLPPDPGVLTEETRGLKLATDDKELIAVKKVHVDPPGSGSEADELRRELITKLRAGQRLVITDNRNDADAVLKSRMTGARNGQISLTVRLINAGGTVVWPVKGPLTGRQYQGSVGVIADQIVRDILSDIQKAERK
jgi:hypothetical protein